MVNRGLFENTAGWVQSWMNKHIEGNCLVYPCPLKGLVYLTCHSTHPAWYHVDNDWDDIFRNGQKHRTGRGNMLVNEIKIKIEKYFNRQ